MNSSWGLVGDLANTVSERSEKIYKAQDKRGSTQNDGTDGGHSDKPGWPQAGGQGTVIDEGTARGKQIGKKDSVMLGF